MKTATATVGTSLEVLQHYLAAGIQVEYVTMHTRYPLRVNELQQSSLFIDQMYALPFAELLPVLRPFSALCTPLEDGTVPAVEVAKIVWPIDTEEHAHLIATHWHLSQYIKQEYISVTRPLGSGMSSAFLEIGADWFMRPCGRPEPFDMPAAIDYLRSKQFAVGLKSGQYVEKSAATPIQEGNSPAG